MRILAINWLDLENPQAGGAEVHFFEIFRRLVDRGHEVTLITSGWRGAAATASISGIAVERVGGRYTFAVLARGRVRRELGTSQYDIVVEDINKLPLYIPTLTDLPFYVIVPHLFGTTAFREASVPVASAVWLAERAIPTIYEGAAFHAISESTRLDLVRRGVPRSAIQVIFPGVDTEWFIPDPAIQRFETPTFLYVGRLKRYKGIDVVLRALALVRAEGLEAKLRIAGRGGDLERLKRLAGRLGLESLVEFHGFVSERQKRDLLRRAWAVVFPSAKEGWGIVNVEAAACGTPALASDSPGLRESVRHGSTGMLVPHGDALSWADAIARLSRQPALVTSLGGNARRFAKTLSWDQAAEETETHLQETLNSTR